MRLSNLWSKQLRNCGSWVIHFDLLTMQEKIEDIERKMLADDFWNDRKKAQAMIDECNIAKEIKEGYESFVKRMQTLAADADLMKEAFDEELFVLLAEECETVKQEFHEYEMKVLLSGPYDHNNAIVELHPGAGGTESQDWAEMLYRMYSRWANKKGYKITVMDYLEGEEAGIKSVSLLIEGPLAYGYLKSERGVHRLVRISPFDAGGRRHTSFASVEVMPQFNDQLELEIDPKDLEIETHRSSGAGGQHINKTDSAVRIIHKPTGIVCNCQSERSQIQNRERAMNMLKSRLYQRMIEEQEAKVKAVKGEVKANEWGSQIRSYVFCPYTLVKDVRTGYEEGNVERVMDGNIDEFIYAYLQKNVA